jgi:hypothetical protein
MGIELFVAFAALFSFCAKLVTLMSRPEAATAIWIILESLNHFYRVFHKYVHFALKWLIPREVREIWADWLTWEEENNCPRTIVTMLYDVANHWICWVTGSFENLATFLLAWVATPVAALIYHYFIRDVSGYYISQVFLPCAFIFPLGVKNRGAAVWAALNCGVSLSVVQHRPAFTWTMVDLIQIVYFMHLMRNDGIGPQWLARKDFPVFVRNSAIASLVGALLGTTIGNWQDISTMTNLGGTVYGRFLRWSCGNIWAAAIGGLATILICSLIRKVRRARS